MNKAIFLDRDGVINIDRLPYTYQVEDFEFVPDVMENLISLHKKGYLFIIISNQGGIGKGLYSKKDADKIGNIIEAEFSNHGIQLSAYYYCPHHPISGNCLCRKPESLLIEKAISRFKINPEISYLIGDMQRDIDAAEKAGVKGILIKANSSLSNVIDCIR